MVKLAIIDDDPLVRAGLKLLLGGDPEINIVAEAGDGAEATALVDEHRPDIVLMDIRMPILDGLSATEQLLQREDPPSVIILTTFDADDMVLRALACGASGFLLKDTPPDVMIDSIKKVASGEHTLSPSVMAQVIGLATKGATTKDVDDLADLNEREKQVAIAIGRGLTNAEIASEQYMSVATVKATITRLLEKLGLTNRVQVAIKVHDAGWLDD